MLLLQQLLSQMTSHQWAALGRRPSLPPLTPPPDLCIRLCTHIRTELRITTAPTSFLLADTLLITALLRRILRSSSSWPKVSHENLCLVTIGSFNPSFLHLLCLRLLLRWCHAVFQWQRMHQLPRPDFFVRNQHLLAVPGLPTLHRTERVSKYSLHYQRQARSTHVQLRSPRVSTHFRSLSFNLILLVATANFVTVELNLQFLTVSRIHCTCDTFTQGVWQH